MDLKTKYMGLELRCPLVASASPLSKDVKNISALAAAGAGAIVLHSIFEEQLEQEALALNYFLERGTEQFAESLTYYPPVESFKVGPTLYLENIEKAKKAADIPIIASLNGISTGGWTSFAKDIEAAGADAIELNVYMIPTNPAINSSVIEKVYLDILEVVKSNVSVPVAMKLSPYFSAFANVAKRLDMAGADALVLFNRFYQPDIDLAEMDVRPRLVLSTSEGIRLPLRWAAILFGKLKCSLAASSGVHTGADAAKLILAGADVVMMTSALLQHGIGHMTRVRDDMAALLAERGYENLAEARGALSQKSVAEPAVFERANYMKTLESWR